MISRQTQGSVTPHRPQQSQHFRYLRVLVALYSTPPPGERVSTLAAAKPAEQGFVLAALTALLVWFGVYPSSPLNLIDRAVASLI